MNVNRGLKIIGYAHTTLLFALLIPLFYTMTGLSDPAGAGVLYAKCLLILIPVAITDWAAKRVKYLVVYLGICAALLATVWGIVVSFHGFDAYAVCYCIGMAAEIFFIALKRLRARVKESPRRKDEDPLAAKEEEFLDTPLLPFLWYFVGIYVLGLCLNGKALCDMAFGSAIVYLFLALIATYFRRTKGYLETNKRIKGIPTRRLYGVSFAMLLLFMGLILIGILPSMLLATHRQYMDIGGWLDGLELVPMESLDEMEQDSGGMEIWEMLQDGEPVKELPAFVNFLFQVFGGVCILALVYGILRAVKRVFQDFRNSRDENGDIIEEIKDKGRTDKEELLEKGRRHTDSNADKIKRRYRKMIRKHRKDRPAPYESPAEIEEGAGLQDDEEMRELHRVYEEVRYGMRVREKRIPFEVSVDPFYSQENMTRLRNSVAQMEATGGPVHEVDFDD